MPVFIDNTALYDIMMGKRGAREYIAHVKEVDPRFGEDDMLRYTIPMAGELHSGRHTEE
ncbi:MAG: hypothetical protein HQK89_07830 [Nitrospirae bacterium]|nr:hypothetical protein [Nitrospirota bacterium]